MACCDLETLKAQIIIDKESRQWYVEDKFPSGSRFMVRLRNVIYSQSHSRLFLVIYTNKKEWQNDWCKTCKNLK